MCGLFGAHSSFLSDDELRHVEILGVLSSFRGKDSTGILTISKNKKGRYIYDSFRALGGAGYVLEMDGVKALFDKAVSTVIGHCRSATIGDITVDNAHPHRHKHIFCTHNGTIIAFNEEKEELKLTSDSQVLTKKLAELPVEDALREANKGAFALVWADVNKGTLHMARNFERPLWYMFNTGKNTIYWASEQEALDWLRQREGKHHFLSPELLRTNTLVTFHNGNSKPELKELKLYRSIQKPVERKFDWEEEYYGEGWLERQRNLRKGWSHNRPVINGPHSAFPKVVDVTAQDITPKDVEDGAEDKEEYIPFGGLLSHRKGETRLTMYMGYEAPMELEEATQMLAAGCQWCTQSKDISDVVWWVNGEDFICDDCVKGNKFAEDYALSGEQAKGEIIKIDPNSLERIEEQLKNREEFQA